MNKNQKTKEKTCAFYASDYHFEMISLPYINKKLDESKEVIVLTENNLKETIKTLVSKINLNEDKKVDILKIDWENNDLNKFKKTNSFSINLTNIGNIDAKIIDIRIENIFANIDTKNVNINLSLDKEDIIKGGETKKLNVEITYNGKDKIEQPYYEFSIKYVFDEVIL